MVKFCRLSRSQSFNSFIYALLRLNLSKILDIVRILSLPLFLLLLNEVWHECVSGNFTSPLLAKIMNIIFNLFAGKCFGLCQSICLFSVFALAQWNLSWMCIWVFCGYLKACIMIFFEWEGIAIAGDICCPFLSSLSVQFK